jgi:hypothetical protein
MEIWAFVVWMIGWPLSCDVIRFLRAYLLPDEDKGSQEGGAWLEFIVWLVVGSLLWSKV